MRVWVLLGFCASVAACNLLIGLRDDYTTDASSDGAGSPDASGVDSGPSDSAFDFTNPCSDGKQHVFCCDFDDGGLCWPTTGATILSTAQFVSPPAAMRSTASTGGGGYGRKTLMATSDAICRFDVYADVLPTAGNVVASVSRTNQDDQGAAVVFDNEPDAGAMLKARLFGMTDAGAKYGNAGVLLPVRRWIRLELSMHVPGNAGATTKLRVLSFDAGPDLDFQTSVLSVQSFDFRAGLNYVNSGQGIQTYVDNVVCDAN